MTSKPPGERGFRLPAEFEPHESTWMAWPHDEHTWVTGVAAAEDALLAMIDALAPETVNLLAREADRERVRSRLDERGLDNARLHVEDYADAWLRDTGPITLVDDRGDRVGVDGVFDAWGGKYDELERDDRIARAVCKIEALERYRLDWVLEGGAIDTDGQGRLLTTETCLIEHRDNPDKRDLERRLERVLGVEEIAWLTGALAGDDTDGHVDAIARFADPSTVLVAHEPNSGDVNHDVLAENRQRLQSFARSSNRELTVQTLPMPGPSTYEGQRLPATYANFYIGEHAVLVPVFDDPADEQALETIEAAVDRPAVGIDAGNLVVGYGSCHCLTMQLPAAMATEP